MSSPPPPGPDTGSPPPGPRLPAQPMSWERRLWIYQAQNGTEVLTDRQHRRWNKKYHRALQANLEVTLP